MRWLCLGILVLSLVVGLLAVVGHGIWVFLAWLFRGRRCPRCGWRLGHYAEACEACGWLLVPGARSRMMEDLAATARQLDRFRQSGTLDATTDHQLSDLIAGERKRLAEPGRPKAVVVRPAPAATPPALPSTPTAPAPTTGEVPQQTAQQDVLAQWLQTAPRDRGVPASAFQADQPAAAPRPPRQLSLGQPQQFLKPRPPRKAFTQMLAAFLEEKNIRWGELVGAVLIVAGSILLVRYFWAEITATPYLQFFIFNAVTAAIFGIGQYTERKWKLPLTSRGLLITATLIVPLNFLAMAAFFRKLPAMDPLALGCDAVALGGFLYLVYQGGRVIVPAWPDLLTLGVLGASSVQLLVRRLPDTNIELPTLLALGSLPVICYGVATGWMIRRARDWKEITESQANAIFILLGAITFAALMPFGLLLYKTDDDPVESLRQLALLFSLGGAPALATGLLLWRRLTDEKLAAVRTAGTSIAVAGALVMLTGMVLAWPHPRGMLPVALLDFAVLTVLAFWLDLPAAHLLAAPCLVVGYLTTFHALREVGWQAGSSAAMLRALLSAASGTALVPLVAMLAIVSDLFRRRGQALHGWFYTINTAGAGVLSLLLVTGWGFARPGDPGGATWVYAIYAVGAFWFARHARYAVASWAGSGLGLAALVQALAYRFAAHPSSSQWHLAMMVHCSTAVVAAALVRRAKLNWRELFADPLSQSALATSLAALLFLLVAAPGETVGTLSAHASWLAVVWMLIAALHAWAELFTAAQVSLTVGVVLAVIAWLQHRQWYAASPLPWLDPRSVQAHGIALSALSIGWVLVRIGFNRFLLTVRGRNSETVDAEAGVPPLGGKDRLKLGLQQPALDTARRLLFPPWPTFDRFVTVAVLIGLLGLAGYGVMPGVAQELSPRGAFADRPELLQATDEAGNVVSRRVPDAAFWDIPDVPHTHALGPGSWVLLVSVVLVLIAGLWERFNPWAVLGVLAALWSTVPLLAGPWESEVSAASALRWLSAGFLALGSIAIWCREGLARAVAGFGWPEQQQRSVGLSRDARTLLFVLAITPLVASLLYVGSAAVARSPLDPWAASTLRWLALWFVMLGAVAVGVGLMRSAGDAHSAWSSSVLPAVLAVGPLAAMTFYVVGVALKHSPIVGPDPESFFHRIGNAVSFGVPLLLITLTLVGYAVREHSEVFAFAGGLMGNVTLTTAYVLLLARGHTRLGTVEWVRLGQFNAIAVAGYGLAWLGALWWSSRRAVGDKSLSASALLRTHIALAVALNLLIIVPASVGLFVEPNSPSPAVVEAGSQWGWLALALAGGAVACLNRSRRAPITISTVSLGMLGIGGLIACTACRWDTAGNWQAYHTLLVSTAAAAWLTLAAGWMMRRSNGSSPRSAELAARLPAGELCAPVTRWCMVMGAVAVIIALRAAADDPAWPWWSVGAIVAVSLLASGLARWTLARGYLYLAGVLFNLATSIWWVSQWLTPGWAGVADSLLELVEVNVVALSLPALAWLALELQVLRPARGGLPYRGLPAFHHVAALGSLIAIAAVVAFGLAADISSSPLHPSAAIGWLALGSVAVVLIVCLWDSSAKYAVAGLYGTGLVAIGMFLDGFDLNEHLLGWFGVIALAAYSVLTSYLWSVRTRLADLAARLGVPRRWDEPLSGQAWLLVFNELLAASVVVLAYWIVLTFKEYPLRLLVAKAALVQAFAVGLLAQGTRRSQLQQVSLLLVVIGSVAWGWAWLEPGTSGNLLNRAVIVMTVLAGMTAIYAIGLVKLLRRENEWTNAALRTSPLLAGLCAAALTFVLGAEVSAQVTTGQVDMAPPAIAGVALALVGMVCTGLILAVVPGRDPLGLSERGRTAYVYAAEVLLALLCMHIRLTMPWLFQGFIEPYWPLIVWAIAFLGVGLSELFRRQQRQVLAEPLERTGALLPVLPVAGFWMVSSEIHYSVVLLLVGLLYGVLSVSRKSFGFGLLAALAANGGLGFLLRERFDLMLHSQFLLVPAALSVLAAAHLNRDRLTKEQMLSTRYIALMTIYVSSTVDIFSNGVKDAPWLPVVLAALSVAGILAGIMFRVRAFLACGAVFLLVALLTMIKYAAVDLHQTWLWYVSVIILGVAILVLFAIFEKKRQDVFLLVEELKQWER